MYGPEKSVNERLMRNAHYIILEQFFLVYRYPCMTNENLT